MGRTFGSLYQRKGRKGYYVRIRRDGREVQKYGGTERQAKKKRAKAEAVLDDGRSLEEVLAKVFGDFTGARLTVRDAVGEYLAYAEHQKKRSTVERDGVRLGTMLDEPWTECYSAAIRPDHLIRWAERRSRSASGPTVNRDLSIVSAPFAWAKRLGYWDRHPARDVPPYSEKGRGRCEFLTAEEARALVEAESEEARPLLAFALSTGMRRGEMLSLGWEGVDCERRRIMVKPEDEKAGRGRAVPLTAAMHEELRRLHARRKVFSMAGRDPVFVRANGKAWNISTLRHASKKARDAAIPEQRRAKVTPHTPRHTGASLMVAQGVTLFDAGKILGHSTPQMTMRYAHFAPDAGRAAVDKLGDALGLGG